jgi:hypothetical protein
MASRWTSGGGGVVRAAEAAGMAYGAGLLQRAEEEMEDQRLELADSLQSPATGVQLVRAGLQSLSHRALRRFSAQLVFSWSGAPNCRREQALLCF